ncbi:MAG: DUF938 domain-containing protein, partial [Bradymonadaceae bacterium]
SEADLPNLKPGLEFDLFDPAPPIAEAQAIICINVIHIAPREATRALIAHAETLLPKDGLLYLYGPFQYTDRPLEPSNENFDRWLKARNPRSGIRSFEAVNSIAREYGFDLVEDRPMPANNRSIWWSKNH